LNPVTSTGCTSVHIGASANLDAVDMFCYLGDMFSVNGHANAAVEAHTHTEPFYGPLGFCPGIPGEPAPER